CLLAKPPISAALCTRGFGEFVTPPAAPIATGRSESCRVGLAPTEDRRLSRRTHYLHLLKARPHRFRRLLTAPVYARDCPAVPLGTPTPREWFRPGPRGERWP